MGRRRLLARALLLGRAAGLDPDARPLADPAAGRAHRRPPRRDLARSCRSPSWPPRTARFCDHGGVDWDALREVVEAADEDGPARGASTIPMQVAKNLFLWPSRSYVRKGLELPVALYLDLIWSKRRMMEIYLNIAEWGDGRLRRRGGGAALFRQARPGPHPARGGAAGRGAAEPAAAQSRPGPPPRHRALAERLAGAHGSGGALQRLPERPEALRPSNRIWG